MVPALLWGCGFCAAFAFLPLKNVQGPLFWALMLIPAALGYLAAPFGRHANREDYRGTRWRVWMALFLSMGLFFGHVLAAYSVIMQEGRSAFEFSLDWLVATAVATCAAALFAVFIARLRGDSWYSLGFIGRDFASCAWLGLRCGLLFLALDLISFKVGQTMDFYQLGGSNAVRVVFETSDRWMSIVATFFGVVLVPFAEEILFRGVLFSALRRTCGVASGIWLSALIFGLFHGAGWQMPFLLGLMLAYLYHRTGSLWTSTIAHMCVNLAALGLGFNRGQALRYLSWSDVGMLVVVIGLTMLVRFPRATPEQCVCGFTKAGGRARCPDCAYPLTEPPLWLRRAMRFGLCAALLTAGYGCVFFDRLASEPYRAGTNGEVLAVQYELLRTTGREPKAAQLLHDWRADQPEAAGPALLLAREAYLREDYAGMVKLVEPVTKNGDPAQAHYVNVAKNMLALALAEQGGPRGEEAVKIARAVHAETPEGARMQIEDTLGWALLRVGQIEEAREYLDRELTVYGLATRENVAELAYHRGVLLWSIGEEDRARQVLALAAQQVPPIAPYTRRAKAILDRNCLPEGLVPLLPPPLPEK